MNTLRFARARHALALLLTVIGLVWTAPVVAQGFFFTIPTCDFQYDSRGGDGPFDEGSTHNATLTGPPCNVPANATAVTVDVTIIAPGEGFLMIYPAGGTPPSGSPPEGALAFNAGRTTANNYIVELGTGGQVSFSASYSNPGKYHVLIAVTSYIESPPKVTSTTPADGASGVALNSNIVINFSENVNVTGSAFELECPTGTPIAFTVTPAPPGGANSFTLDPTADLPLDETCTVTVTATEVTDTDGDDPPNAMEADYTFSFSTFETAPSVVSTTPTDGAAGVAANTDITIDFNENVNVTASAFTLECPAATPIPFTLTPAPPGGTNSFTLDPTADLPVGTVCTVTVVASQVTDVDADDPPDTMAANYTFTFTTSDPAPSVTTTTPADGAANVATNTNITVNFSEPVDVTGSAFTLECPVASPVAFTVSPAPPGSVASFTLDPTADLPSGVTCTVTVVATQVTDVDTVDPPDQMLANYVFSFTTEAAPSVTTTTPADGATNVATNTNITVDFSEAVNVTGSAFTLECPVATPITFTLSPVAPGGVASFTLDPTTDLPSGVTCTVTVVATQVTDVDAIDPPDQMLANYVFSFTTDAAPSVTTTTPADGAANVAANTNITVNFNEAVNVTGSAFTLECPVGSPIAFTLSPAAPGGVASFTLDPTADLPLGVTCTVTVVATQVTDVDAGDPPDQMAANHVFSFTTDAAPSVTTTTPANGAANVATDTNITVNFSEPVNVTGSAFTLECPAASPIAFTLSPAAPGGVASFTLDPTANLPQGVSCTVTVVATQVTDVDANDPPDQMLANYVFTFTTDSAPSVTTTTPADGATNVAANSNITVNFSEAVNVTGSAFTLECPVGSPIAFTLSPAAPGGVASFTLDPTADLPQGVSCRVTVVATQVTDVDANDPPDQMAANYVFNFTTDSAPSVTTTTPANGATNVATNTNITVNFSESVNVTGSAFTLECPVASPVAFNLSPAAPGGVASFTLDPTTDLPPGVTCTVTVVATQVTDVDANDPPDQMAANHVFSFTTDAAPSVTTTVPVNGAISVLGTSTITINFSESVNASGSSFQLECPTGSGARAFSLSASPSASFTLTPTLPMPGNQVCTVTVFAAFVTDVDVADPPDTMQANYSFSFTIANTPPQLVTTPPFPKETFDTIGNTAFEFKAAQSLSPGVFVLGNLRDNFTDTDGPVSHFVERVVGCADLTAPYDCATANGGSVSLGSNGEFSFTPEAGDTALSDSFTYRVSDGAATVDRLVTLNRRERVWYVKNNDPLAAPAFDDGTSVDPFNTLNAAQTASLANDYIFVYFGDGASTGQTAGILLKAGQHLIGEHAGLTVPITSGSFNGVAAPTSVPLVTAAPGNRPLIDHSGAGNNAVSATDAIPVEIVGLSLQSANANAIDLTNALGMGTATLSIQNNVIRTAGQEGIDINLNAGTAGTLTLNVTGNSWNTGGTHTGNAVDINRVAGTLNINFSNNTNVISANAAGAAVNIAGGATASTTIIGFANNTVHQNAQGAGIAVSNVTFDLTPGGAIQPVSGGSTVIGQSGDGVTGAGLSLTTVTGALAFTDLDIFSGGAALSATGTGGFDLDVTSGLGQFVSTGGAALSLSTLDADIQSALLTSTTSTSGVSLTTVSGTVSASSSSSITKSSGGGTAFSVATSSATVSYAGVLDVTSGAGVSLTSNTGTMSFSGGMTLSTGANTGFNATGGGTVTVTDPVGPGNNTITTTTGTALNVTSTAIGASGLTFERISSTSAGGSSGIVLNSTCGGAACNTSPGFGGLTVSGNGGSCTSSATCTGGAIQNKTVDGISLNNTRSVSLTRMFIDNNDGSGIFGDDLTNFSLISSVISNNTDVTGGAEAGLRFNELLGTCAITNSTIANNLYDNIRMTPASGTLTALNITGSTIGPNDSGVGNDGILLLASGSANATLNVSTTTFNNNRASQFQVSQTGSGLVTVDVSNNDFLDGNIAIDLGHSQAGDLTFNVDGNDVVGADSNVINFSSSSTSTNNGDVSGKINNNKIGCISSSDPLAHCAAFSPSFADSGSRDAFGIGIDAIGDVDMVLSITNNRTRHTDFEGIFVESAFDDTDADAEISNLDLTLRDNDVGTPDDNSAFPFGTMYGIRVEARHTSRLCMDIAGNNASSVGGVEHIRVRQRNTGTFLLERLTDGDGTPNEVITTMTTVESFMAGQNDAGTTVDATNQTAGVTGFTEAADGACENPL